MKRHLARRFHTHASWMKPFISDAQKVVVLDGGTGTTLGDRGLDLTHPLWSAQPFYDKNSKVKLSDVEQMHLDFLKAGADVIQANTYKVSDLLLKHYRSETTIIPPAKDIMDLSVKLAVGARNTFVHGLNSHSPYPLVCCCLGPYGTAIPQFLTYSGNYDITDEELHDFWSEQIDIAFETQADLIAFETIPDLRETETICNILNSKKINKPVWLTWTCKDEGILGDGSDLVDAIKKVGDCQFVQTIGLNCCSPELISPSLKLLTKHAHKDKSFIVYPNAGKKWGVGEDGIKRWVGDSYRLEDYVEEWINLGAHVIGGCCQVDPTDTHEIAKKINLGKAFFF